MKKRKILPNFVVTKKCSHCNGAGDYKYFDDKLQNKVWEICPKCNGSGKVDVKQNDPNFKKYYIENLKDQIDYFTHLYRNKNALAKDFLGKVSEYYKELDKVINKWK